MAKEEEKALPGDSIPRFALHSGPSQTNIHLFAIEVIM